MAQQYLEEVPDLTEYREQVINHIVLVHTTVQQYSKDFEL